MKFSPIFRTALCLILLASVCAGCTNTVRGLGQDTEQAGQKIQGSTN